MPTKIRASRAFRLLADFNLSLFFAAGCVLAWVWISFYFQHLIVSEAYFSWYTIPLMVTQAFIGMGIFLGVGLMHSLAEKDARDLKDTTKALAGKKQ